jgi:hypothetical protein
MIMLRIPGSMSSTQRMPYAIFMVTQHPWTPWNEFLVKFKSAIFPSFSVAAE